MTDENKVVEEKDLTKEMYDACIPVAQEVLKMLGAYENKLMGQVDQKAMNEAYKDLVQDIKKLLLEKNIKLGHIEFIKQLLFQPIEAISYVLTENINNSLGQAYDKFWGKERDEITIQDLDYILK